LGSILFKGKTEIIVVAVELQPVEKRGASLR